MTSQPHTLEGGFADPAINAAQAFRPVMDAMARPGSIQTIQGARPPSPLSPAAGAILLTLCDSDTPLYLAGAADCPAVRDWLAFHTGAPLAGPSHCMFAIGQWSDLVPLETYPVGTSEYPDRSATLIVDHADLNGTGTLLKGPGIKETAALTLPDPKLFRENHGRFPLGLDFFFTCSDRLAALPRSTEVL